MPNLVLFLYLRNDPSNPLSTKISYLEKEGKLKPLEGRDGVILLSDNAVVFDRTKAHDVFAQLCVSLDLEGRPYLIIPIDATPSCVVVGVLPKEVSTSLSKYGFPSPILHKN